MKDDLARCCQLLPRLAEALVEARARGTSTEALGRHLDELARSTSGVTVDLARERDPVTDELQHDVVVMVRGGGSFLLSFGPEDERPWVLRGGHHWGTADLLRAGDEVFLIEEAIVMLEMLWTDPLISRKIVARALTKAEVRRRRLTVTDEQLEAFIERFRRSRRLLSGTAFEAWLAERGLTLERFAEQMRAPALALELRRSHAGDATAYFEVHARDLDRVTLATWWTADEAEARALHAALAAGQSFWEVASLVRALPRFGRCFSGELPAALGGGRRSPGELVGPLPAPGRPDTLVDRATAAWQAFEAAPLQDGFAVYRIMAWEEARLDGETRAAIEQRLFDGWIDDLGRVFPVQWNWGERRDDDAREAG